MPSDLPPDPARLRVLETWLRLELARVREAIAEVERRQAALAAAEPEWWVQWMRQPAGHRKRGVLHRKGCWCPGKPELGAADVRRLVIEHGGRIERCTACRAEPPAAAWGGPRHVWGRRDLGGGDVTVRRPSRGSAGCAAGSCSTGEVDAS